LEEQELQNDVTLVSVPTENGSLHTEDFSQTVGESKKKDPAVVIAAIGPIGANFEILGMLGEGAMGVVLKARHLLLDKIVAIKVLKEEFSRQSKIFLRFQQEARTTSQLSHENIAMVHDFGLTDTGHPFIVMDFVEGQTLDDLLDDLYDQKEAISEDQAIDIFKQVSKALIHAHEKGVVHRDLKPSNIILQKRSNGAWLVKVVDFGIAKVLTEDQSSPKLTQTGEIFGTPLYMSPEQCQGQAIDHRTDIYSLGCLMYEVLTGKPPFAGDSTFALLLAQVSQAPKPFKEIDKNLEISDALERIVFHAMEKSPEDRYQSAAALLTELESLAQAGAVIPASKLYSQPKQQKRRRLVLFGVLATALLTTAVLAFLALPHFNFKKPEQYPWSQTVNEAMQLRSIDASAAEAGLRRALTMAQEAGAKPTLLADIEYEIAVLLFIRRDDDPEAYKLFKYVADVEPQDTLRYTNTLDYLSRAEIGEAGRLELSAKKSNDSEQAKELLQKAAKLRSDAVDHATKAVEIKIRLSGSENSYVENARRTRGLVLYANGRFQEAEDEYKRALEIAKKLDMGDAEAGMYRNLAKCSGSMERFDEAKNYYQMSIEKYKAVFGPESPIVDEVRKEYRKLHRQLKRADSDN
jgi:serine/threonine protein kinase